LKNKILKLYNNKKLREKLIDWGLKNVENFSLKKYLVSLNKIYEEL
jgi:glycosyltransferase involved in cell wall biosynthesis